MPLNVAVLLLLVAPDPLDDLRRFPSAKFAECNAEFADKYKNWVAKELGRVQPTWQAPPQYISPELLIHSPRRACLIAAYEEVTYCHACWNWLYLSHEADSREGRLCALRHLRELLGDSAFVAGWMPPAAPYWRFVEVRVARKVKEPKWMEVRER